MGEALKTASKQNAKVSAKLDVAKNEKKSAVNAVKLAKDKVNNLKQTKAQIPTPGKLKPGQTAQQEKGEKAKLLAEKAKEEAVELKVKQAAAKRSLAVRTKKMEKDSKAAKVKIKAAQVKRDK